MFTGKKDAYGQMLKAFYDGQDAEEIVERDDGFISGSGMGPRTYFSTFEAWPSRIQEAIGRAKGRVVDIGCGAARFSLHLQNKGLEVVGVDNSELALQVCVDRGLKNTFAASIDEINPKLGKFDTFLMMGNNFGLFASFDKAKMLLERFHAMSNDGATIIAESTDPYTTTFKPHLDYHKRNIKKGRMGGQIRLRVRYQIYKTPYFDYLLASPAEMKSILGGTGWELGEVFAGNNGLYIAHIKRVSKPASKLA